MSSLVIDREQAQLDLAFDPRRMGPLLARAFEAYGGCHILDAKYAPHEHCTVLYELGGQLILGVLGWDGTLAADDRGQDIPEVGMRAYRFPDDPALPGLPAALDPVAVVRVLDGVLGERVLRCAVTLLRYRPTRRATLRLDLRTSAGRAPRTLFVKVYHDAHKALGVASTLRALADTSAVRTGRLVIASPIAAVDALRWVLFDAVGGVRLDVALACGGQAVEAVTAAAGALAALHSADGLPARPRPVTAQLARVARRAERTAEVAPALGAAMGELAVAVAGRLPDRGETTLIHGDCKPSQFLVGPNQGVRGSPPTLQGVRGSPPTLQGVRGSPPTSGVALLDLDSCGLADPASDVGAFLGWLRAREVRARLAGLRPKRVRASFGDGFLDAYCAAAGRGADFRSRVAWYEALSLLGKAQRAFARAPRSPLPAAILAEARVCVRRGVD
ncbi:MAG: phosphotransferase family protein [Egibacteraceae bacterium]